MTENDTRHNKNKHLKYISNKYLEHIICFEKHIERLHNCWIINVSSRITLLQKLNNIAKSINRIHHSMTTSQPIDPIYQNIYEGLLELERFEKEDICPLDDIKMQLISFAETNGSYSMGSFFKLYFYDRIVDLLYDGRFEFLELYDKIFVPLNVAINNLLAGEGGDYFHISKVESKYHALIDNVCQITIIVENREFVFEGYVSIDVLGLSLCISDNYRRYLSLSKKTIRSLLSEKNPEIDVGFINKYLKLVNLNTYASQSPEELAEQISENYLQYRDLTSKKFNQIMKDFTQSDVKKMHHIIFLLILGNEEHTYMGALLFNLLKDKKVNGEVLSDIIYCNFSYQVQALIKKVNTDIKKELARLKTLNIESVTIEKRLATSVDMPDSVKYYILEKMNEIKAGENSYKLQMAINGLMQYPWKPKTPDSDFLNLGKSRIRSQDYLSTISKNLEDTIYGHRKSKELLIELIGKWISNSSSPGQIIGFLGPPGVGKTLFAQSISKALNIPMVSINLGGMSDSADLVGHSFTYAGAQYGMIVRQMIKAGSWRCIMFFDELDKVAKRNDTNEIFNTLVHITDKNTNCCFHDRFYSSAIDFDLSGVLMIFSYNSAEKIDPILYDRIKEVTISPYSVRDKVIIAQKYIIKELCEHINFDQDKIHFDDEVIQYIIEKYTNEAGVRELCRKLEQILLKLNVDRIYLTGPFKKLVKSHSRNENELDDTLDKIFRLEFEDPILITINLIHKYLDKSTSTIESVNQSNLIGVANGLYATSLGHGGILPIQIYPNYLNDSESIYLMTGNQKQIMKESVNCALTTAISLIHPKKREEIMSRFSRGFHVHAPDGGTPKDGPSAGSAFVIAFVSILLGKKINRFVAITGEIQLTGKISKIGSLDTKLLGAKKAGIKYVYIPSENKDDYEATRKQNPDLFNKEFLVKMVDHIMQIVLDPNVIIDISAKDFDPYLVKQFQKVHCREATTNSAG